LLAYFPAGVGAPDSGQAQTKMRHRGAGFSYRESAAIVQAMKATIDSAGRLLIPKAIRRATGLTPNMVLEVRSRDGVIEIEPAPSPVVLERQGRLLIAAPARPTATLTSEMVEQTRRRVRRGEATEPETSEA